MATVESRDWEVRESKEKLNMFTLYGSLDKDYIGLKVYHDGYFSSETHNLLNSIPVCKYSRCEEHFIDFMELEKFNKKTVEDIATILGHGIRGLNAFVLRIEETLDVGLMKLEEDDDFDAFIKYVKEEGKFDCPFKMYFDHGDTTVYEPYPESLKYATAKRLSKLVQNLVNEDWKVRGDVARAYVLEKYKVKLSWKKFSEAMDYAREVQTAFAGDESYVWI